VSGNALRNDLKPADPVHPAQAGFSETQAYQALDDSDDRRLRCFAGKQAAFAAESHKCLPDSGIRNLLD
jgi:hypothetical protein